MSSNYVGRLTGPILALLLLGTPFLSRSLSLKSDVVLVLLFASLGFLILFLIRAGFLRVPYPILLLVGFLVLCVVSSFQSLNFYASLVYSLEILALILIFLLIFNLGRGSKLLCRSIVLAGIIASLWGLVDFALKGSGVVQEPFGWYNQMAGYLLFPLFLLLTEVWKSKTGILRLLNFGGLAIVACAFVLTYSRAGYLSFLVGGVVFLLSWRTSLRLRSCCRPSPRTRTVLGLRITKGSLGSGRFLIVFLFAFLISPLAFFLFGGRNFPLQRVWNVADWSSSGAYRVALYRKAVEIGKDHLWLGTGPATFFRAYQVYQDTPWFYSRYAHNFFLQIFAEVGALATLLWAGFFVVFANYCLVSFRRPPAFRRKEIITDDRLRNLDRPEISPPDPSTPLGVAPRSSRGEYSGLEMTGGYGAALSAAAVASLAHNLFDLDWSVPGIFFTFFVILALLSRYYQIPSFRLNLNPPRRVFSVGLLFVVFLFGFTLLASRSLKKLADYLGRTGQPARAERLLKICARLTPFNARYHYDLAGHLFAKGDLGGSERRLETAIAFDEWSSKPYLKLGRIAELRGDYNQAKTLYEKSVSLFPYTYPKSYLYLADFCRRQGDFEGLSWVAEVFPERFPLNRVFENYKFIYAARGAILDMALVYDILAAEFEARGLVEESMNYRGLSNRLLEEQRRLAPSWLETY